MLKLLTRFRGSNHRDHNHQNPNPNLNPDDNSQQQQQHQEELEENNADDDDDVSGCRDLQTASSTERRLRDDVCDDVSGDIELLTPSSSKRRTGDDDDDDDVSGDRELQTASSSERKTDDDDDDDDDVSGDRELQMASSCKRRRTDVDDLSRGREIEAVDEEAELETETGTASSGERKAGRVDAEKASALTCGEEKKRMEAPPSDDCCPICFGNFVVPCRGPCGHWYCGGCILQYWNYTAALQPCNCPMCSGKITKLTPEASLNQQREAEVVEVLRNVQKYNRLFVGGTYGLILKVFELPLYIKRMFSDMMNPDRPGAHLNKLRIFAMFLGFLYSISPFDFLRIGRHNVVDLFDYSAIAISLILYGFGIYLRRRRFQNVRELAAIQL